LLMVTIRFATLIIVTMLVVPCLAQARLVIEDPFAPIACTMEQDCTDLGGTTCRGPSGPLDPMEMEMCPSTFTCICDDIYDFPQDPVFRDAVAVPLEAGALGLDPMSTAFTITRNGVQFDFQSASSTPLFVCRGAGGSAPPCPLTLTGRPSQPIVVTMSPPVPAFGVVGEMAECGYDVTIIGDAGTEAHSTDFDPTPVFIGADQIGGIGSASLSDTCMAFGVWTELRFVPPGPTGPGLADVGLEKTAPSRARANARLTYALGVDNAGPDNADDVLVIDFLPRQVSVNAVSSGGTYDAAAGVVTWPLSTVPAGMASDPSVGPMVDITTLPFISGSCLAPSSRQGLACTVAADCDSAPMAGDGVCHYEADTFTCEDTLTNVAATFSLTSDPHLANNFAFTTTEFDKSSRADLPENCETPVDDNCDGLNNCADPVCRCGLFAPEPDEEPNGDSGDDEGGGNDCRGVDSNNVPACCCARPHSPACDLSACGPVDPNFKEADPPASAVGLGAVEAGATIRYTIHYENIGGVDATDVRIVDPLDTDLDDTTLIVEDDGVYDPVTRIITWSDPLLPTSTPRAVHFSAAVRADAPPGTRVWNRATIVFPTALVSPRTDTKRLEHVVVDPTVPKGPALRVIGCAEASPSSGEWRVMLENGGLGFAYNVTATILDPPASVQVVDGEARFAHPSDVAPDTLATVMGLSRPVSLDTVTFTTETETSPCDALVWSVCYQTNTQQSVCEDVQYRPDRDQDAVADEKDNCPTVFNPTQADSDGNGVGDACGGTVLCSTLGLAHKFFFPDHDVFTFTGTQGEAVTLRLEKDPAGTHRGRRAALLVKDAIRRVWFWRKDKGSVPNEITATLPATGTYRVIVGQYPWFFHWKRFRGAYCVTMESSGNAFQTLKATRWVE
jgi:uncharacterized repeat protein (TIGR01451 family)